MAVFKRNVHLGTKEPLIETDDIADKAVTSEKIDDKAVAMPKIGDDVKQYIATQVGTETTDREGEIERLEGLIDLERSDRDTEEGAIWADVRKKANIVDIRDYMSENVRLPLNGAYNYEGIPVTAVPANIDTASVIEGVSPGDSDIETFILFRVEADVSYKPAHLFYVCFWENGRYANRWFANDAPEDVKRVFNDNIVASDVAGLMSATDKNNLDTAVSDLSVVKGKIAPAASSTNQLADKDFVNSSIATNTATFRGTVDSVSALDNIVGADENDYAFVTRTDESGNLWYDRYKRTGNSWLFEYTLNNSSFTAEQWAAINSGLNSNDRGNVDTAVRNASTAVGTANTALGQSDTALLRSGEAVGIARNNAHIVANLEGAFTGTSPIYDFSPETEYGIDGNKVRCCYKDGLLYRAITTHTGAWDTSHFEQISVFDLLKVLCGIEEIPTWESIKPQPTIVGTLVIYEDKLYKFDEARAADEEWDSTKVHLTSLWAEIDAMVKSDYEQVNIELKTETGEALPNVEVVVTVEGEEAPRNLTTDNTGKCSTNIPKGVEYTVACASVPNYYPVETVVRRASIPVRYVNFTYIEDDTLTREAVKITLTYADSTLTKATWVRVSYGGENYQLALNENNVAETSIPLGTQYTVTFEDIEGYKTPAPQTYTAQLHGTRNINVRYNAPVSGVKWLMKNGAERELNDVTNTERLNGDIFGLIVQTSDLMQAGCSYVIPLDMLLTQSATSSGQWLSSNVTVPHLQYFGSHAAALADFDGEANCLAIEQFIAEKAAEGTTYTSSMVSNCRNRVGGAERFKDTMDYAVGDYVVYRNMLHVFTSPHTAGEWVDGETESMYGYIMPDGRVRRCFQPSYAQIYAFRLLRDRVNGFTTDVFGIGCCAIASGWWWTSTQCNAGIGVGLNLGGFYSNLKNNYCTLLPVLAY